MITISSRSLSGADSATASLLPEVPVVVEAAPGWVCAVPSSAPAVPEKVPADPAPAGFGGAT
ncbi:hypothetical protein [uncultured Sphingomonas sp.]|uniref:hypothetical protein n=1 Tax=uncultured Sphingomonas sp. TaxID=158754 RepID=UPI0035C9AB76